MTDCVIDVAGFPKCLFITGIGTDVGKSWATGWLARELHRQGIDSVTQKFVQTGCVGRSEDIETHRRIMGIDPLPEDKDLTTAPQIFSYPCSADLAARIDGRRFDPEAVARATARLERRYDAVLIEGAGGLMVPLDGFYTTLDYVRHHRLPTAVVTNGQLGSISNTLLTLGALHHAGVDLWGVIYNPWFDRDKTICDDTRAYIAAWLADRHPDARFVIMPEQV